MCEVRNAKRPMGPSLGRKFHVESESEVKLSPIRRPDPENEEKLPPDVFVIRSPG